MKNLVGASDKCFKAMHKKGNLSSCTFLENEVTVARQVKICHYSVHNFSIVKAYRIAIPKVTPTNTPLKGNIFFTPRNGRQTYKINKTQKQATISNPY